MRRLAIALLAAAACGHRGPDVRHAEVASPVRLIDWQNYTYTLGNGLGPVTVTKGDADFAIAGGEGQGSYHVEPPQFADIDQDGVEDAVISAVTATGGTGQFSEVDVYTVRDHKVVDLATITGGDRGDGGIRSVTIDGAAIVVERNVLAEGDGICCASKMQTERWVWKAGALVEDVAARTAVTPVSPPGPPRGQL